MQLMRCVMLGAMVLLSPSPGVTAHGPAQRTLVVRSRVFENTRSIRVLLPPGYDAPENRARRYPVFYFTDGVAAWDAWGVPDTFTELWDAHAIPAIIVVGIDNGGSTPESEAPERDRASEYLPYADQTWTEDAPDPRGDRFPDFLFEEVVPLIDDTFRTIPAGRCTGLAGASYGAAVTVYTAMRFPERLGFVLLESPSLYIGDRQLLRDAAETPQWPQRVYIGVGTAEGDTREARDQMVTDARALRATLDSARPGPVVLFIETKGATHWYSAWRERLPVALKFLLSGAEGTGCLTPSADQQGDAADAATGRR